MSLTGGYMSDQAPHEGTTGGAVFITDINAQSIQENVGAKVYSSDGIVLDSCSSSTSLVTVSVIAITGSSSFKPSVTVNEQQVSLIQNEDQTVWFGSIDIDLGSQTSVTAQHIDGASHSCLVQSDTAPTITSAEFTGLYPIGQTELKENDLYSLLVQCSTEMTTIELDDFGAAKAEIFNFSETRSKVIDITIANRGNFSQALGVRVRAINTNGTKSAWYSTIAQGSINGINTVILNNVSPVISIDSISYPDSQAALKNLETAFLNHNIQNFDRVVYESLENQLTINSTELFNPSKEIQRNSGDYNVDQPNLKLTAFRNANGSELIVTVNIKIAHKAAILNLQEPKERLISGGNLGTEIQVHELSIISDQELINSPTITPEQGTIDGQLIARNQNKEFALSIRVHDNDLKGIHAIQLIKATNLAGVESIEFEKVAAYEIGGFVTRTLSFIEFANEVSIGTQVSQIEKVIALDQNRIAMQLNMDSTEGGVLQFAITQPSLQANPIGNLFYWKDSQAVNNNSTGLATVTIEERP